MDPRAAQIRKADIDDAARTLNVSWRDGHESVYPLAYLRAECPCASCRTEREERRSNPFRMLPATPPSEEIVDIEPVGRYGMKPVWKDGHSTGIYTLELLRELCPCPDCSSRRKKDETPYVHGIYIPKA